MSRGISRGFSQLGSACSKPLFVFRYDLLKVLLKVALKVLLKVLLKVATFC
jgi:hypothetical protein